MRVVVLALAVMALLAPRPAGAQHLDVTVFAGQAFPVLDGRLVLRAPAVPSLPGFQVTTTRTPELRTDGGPVFGVAVALEVGVLGVEGRLDSTRVGLDAVGARYDLRGIEPPYAGLTGSVSIGDGRFDIDRLNIVSANLRVRTPGPIGLQASGGLSYLPDIRVSGSVPVSLQAAGLPILPGISPRLALVATPDQSADRWGLNAGAGVRIGIGGRIALVAEARLFYFGDYRLAFRLDDPIPFVDDLVSGIDEITFRPVIVNAQAGLAIRF